MLTRAQALLLGALQGVTEVVPVSSSAHLTAVPWLLGWPPPAHRTALAAGLHAGSCLGIGAALLTGPRPAARTCALAAATCLPASVAGLVAADAVERRLGRPAQLAGLLAGAGVLLVAADQRAQDNPVGPRAAAWAALAQVAALAPGVSRSGAALTALRLARVGRAPAQEFSLLMSLPVTAGAAALTLLRSDRDQVRAVLPALLVGTPAAALAGYVATRIQARRGAQALLMFGLYRGSFAAAVLSTSRKRGDLP